MNRSIVSLCLALAVGAAALSPPAAQAAPEVAHLHRGPSGLTLEPVVAHAGGQWTVTGPRDYVRQGQLLPGASLRLDLTPEMEDGLYRFELRLKPEVDAATGQALAAARATGEAAGRAAVRRLREEGKLPTEPWITAGSFRVAQGALIRQQQAEEEPAPAGGPATFGDAGSSLVPEVTAAASAPFRPIHSADQIILDDLIVDGLQCVGFACVNGESFGADTLRLKETTTQIHFLDTSIGAFPGNDWRLVANDSAAGGVGRFSIDDATGSTTPFTVEAGTRNHALYVDGNNRVGFGTQTPVEELHYVNGDSPGIRLEQDGSDSFIPQTWDVVGNEANFFIEDVTHAGKLVFRIRPDAPADSLYVEDDGNVGMGTGNPVAGLHVLRGGTEAVRDLLQLTNNGRVRWRLQDTSADGQTLTVRLAEGDLDFSFSGTAGDQVEMKSNGNMVIQGTLTQMSDRDRKTEIEPIEPRQILTKVLELPIAHWKQKGGDPETRHLGPMAQDFHALFGLGGDDRHIATLDTSGVALAAIQALHEKLEERDGRIAELEARLAALEAER